MESPDQRSHSNELQAVDTLPGKELALQTLLVILPEEPVHINGSLYELKSDDALIIDAVNHSREHSFLRGIREPEALRVSYGQSLHPWINGSEEKQPLINDPATNSLEVVIPGEVVDSTISNEEIVKQIERGINRDIFTGLLQNRAIKSAYGWRKFNLAVGAIALGAVGEGVGVAISEGVGGQIFYGSLYGVTGGVAALGLAFGKHCYNVHRHGSDEDAFVARSQEKIQNGHWQWIVKEMSDLFEKPLVKLVPIQKRLDV